MPNINVLDDLDCCLIRLLMLFQSRLALLGRRTTLESKPILKYTRKHFGLKFELKKKNLEFISILVTNVTRIGPKNIICFIWGPFL